MDYIITAEYDQYTEGLFLLKENQQLNELELSNLYQHNEIEKNQSLDIQLYLSSKQGLEYRINELDRLILVIIDRIDQLEQDIDSWDDYVKEQKQKNNDLDSDTEEDFTFYLSRSEYNERKKQKIEYWNEKSRYHITYKKINEMKKEIAQRTADELMIKINQLYLTKDRRLETLKNTRDWNITWNIDQMIGEESMKQTFRLLIQLQHQKDRLLIKDEIEKQIKELADKHAKITSEIKVFRVLIDSHESEIEEATITISEIYEYDNYDYGYKENELSDTESENSL
jgi:hypothetical protein